jgi:hypothetical protein
MGNSCVVPDDFKTEITYCYADWSSSFDEKTPFGPYKSANITNDTA